MNTIRREQVSRYGSRRFVSAMLLVAVTALTSFAVIGRKLPPLPMSSQPEKAVTSNLVQPSPPNPPRDVLLITLTPTGFEPGEITHPVGSFLFGINNRSGLSDLVFRLTTASGGSKAEQWLSRGRVWRKVLELPAGVYHLRVIGHPAWACSITITAS